MKISIGNFLFTFICLVLLFNNLTRGQDSTQVEKDLIKTVEQFLFFAGNFNIESMSKMMTDHVNVGIAMIKDGKNIITSMTVEQYFEETQKRTPRPYFEPVNEYTIHSDDERLAFVKADATLYVFGVPQSYNADYFTLMKENDVWKFLSLSYTPTPIPDAQKIFDLNIFGRSYAQAWCSRRPEFVSLYFAENGSLTVNDGTPAMGRKEISKVAESFMTAFPDIIVTMDSLVTTSEGAEFHWTFTGTNSGPGGSGMKVKISGVEIWQLDDNGLIKKSQGSFDVEEYKRQIKYGVEE